MNRTQLSALVSVVVLTASLMLGAGCCAGTDRNDRTEELQQRVAKLELESSSIQDLEQRISTLTAAHEALSKQHRALLEYTKSMREYLSGHVDVYIPAYPEWEVVP